MSSPPSGRNHEARQAAADRQAQLTKPPGSLRVLEEVALDLAEIQGAELPVARPAAALIFAADHPVVRHGVAAYPASITAGMVVNLAVGGAAASVASKCHGIPLEVHDVGVSTPYELPPSTSSARVVRHPSAEIQAGDLRVEDAMSSELFEACYEAGRSAVLGLDRPAKVLLLGEMGIGNTTPSSAVAAALLGLPAERMVGPGTGLDEAGVALKAEVVRDALARLDGDESPFEILRRVGGRELVAIAGAADAARETGAAIIVDGFIVTAALLAAVRAQPALRQHLVFGHRSGEPGHAILLEALSARPLLDLGLRLGEGSGALAAYGLVELAVRLHGDMATFDDAGLEGGPGGGESAAE
ncbi:MAG: nicotinate-nucleotide--dimethylbenzimidazole phosphoribosyltransferase [Planctomycetota bacterium]|nr:nicotinate-nucleotide--dimethylbenzimidazole phosphoribosyltransferase [Planctomycetota bacterium]